MELCKRNKEIVFSCKTALNNIHIVKCKDFRFMCVKQFTILGKSEVSAYLYIREYKSASDSLSLYMNTSMTKSNKDIYNSNNKYLGKITIFMQK